MSTTASPTAAPSYDNTVSPADKAARHPSAFRRIASLDIVRGAVMVLMAIDHVRVFAGVPTGGPPGIFFTRWVTHFCAPTFIFLAGTAAYLYGQRVQSRSELSKFLLLRGLWLVVLELTLLRFGWTFNFDYASFTFAGVIWAIGWSMVILAALVYLPVAAITAIGLVIIVGHNAIAPLIDSIESPSWILRVLYAGGNFSAGSGINVVVLYTLIPWVGVMAAGYGFGTVMRASPEKRRRLCYSIGAASLVLFFVLRATSVYGDPRPWQSDQGVLPFLNPAKYPASLLFLLMTLGPVMLAIPLLENARGRVARWLGVFGQVPFFYYVLHIPLIHLTALLISMVRTPTSTGWLVANHPMLPPDVPPGYQWSLPLLYLVAAVMVTILYFLCRWFAGVKSRSRDGWARFL
ncbi:MAG TPA: heparan-alpha-glucosaminide N-acetyltransferase domain-containing protein [Gemmatimonadaceae bacterium]|nr:heparan-alpha-glucosaminide N-acetyltransferase domain-containing protein [Gemmatimonadaceae bacterium]